MTPYLQRLAMSLLVVLNVSALAGSPEPQSPILKRYSLEELDSALTVLKTVIDTGRDPIDCHLTPEVAKKLILPLHPLWDEKLAQVAKRTPDTSRFTRCALQCHCSAYLSVIEKRRGHGVPARVSAQVEKDAATTSVVQTEACARKIKWFCGSPLHRHLVKASGQFLDGAAF